MKLLSAPYGAESGDLQSLNQTDELPGRWYFVKVGEIMAPIVIAG
jgi:hypothetical protein